MSFDRLINKIIEMKNPSVAGLDPRLEYVPEYITKASFEKYVLERILDLKFEFINYRWIYNDIPVLMGDFQHDYTSELSN